jgi:hypothetical protein
MSHCKPLWTRRIHTAFLSLALSLTACGGSAPEDDELEQAPRATTQPMHCQPPRPQCM